MAEFVGWQRYVFAAAEAVAWGTAGTTYSYIPVESQSLKDTPVISNLQPYLGIRQPKNSRKKRYTVAGQLAMPFWGFKQNAKCIPEWFIEWGLSAPAGVDLDPFTLETGEAGTDNKRWLGCRVNSFTLAGDADSGVIKLTVDVIGKAVSGGISLQAIPSDMDELHDADFADTTFTVGAVGALSAQLIKSFSWTVNNNLVSSMVNATTINSLKAGLRTSTFNMVLHKDANTYDAFRRTMGQTIRGAQLVVKALHGAGGGTPYRRLTLDLNRLAMQDVGEQGVGLNEIALQQVDFLATKPDSSDNDITTTWADAA